MIATDTEALLQKLSDLKWFGQIGKAAPKLPVPTKVVSVGDAGRCLEDIKWQNFTLMLKNSLMGGLTEAAYNRGQIKSFANDLNASAAEIEAAFRSRIEKKLVGALPFASRKVVERTVAKEIMCVLIETQFASSLVGQTLFFSEVLLPIYLAGHLPCGWQGTQIREGWRGKQMADLPTGHLMVA